jgi:hypothetical protein
MKRAIGLLVLIFAVTLFGAYVSSVRANATPPCEAGDNWKYLYCHNGHTICVGDPNDAAPDAPDVADVGHTEHGIDHPGNPPRGCSFLGCCSQGGPEGQDCKKDTGKSGS